MMWIRRPSRAFVSKLPLRARFSLVVAALAASVIGSLSWLCLQMLAGEAAATLWFSLSGILLVTLLVDQAARRLLYRPLAHMRETMQRAAAGDLTARVSLGGGSLDEIGVIARGLNDILEGLERLHDAIDVRVEAATAVFRHKSAEIADSHREMAVLSEELARAGRLAALGQAAANMAHQIGTPLNLISGYVQVLIQSMPRESPATDRLKAIQEQVAKVSAIVRAALDSSRASSTPRERVDFAALVKRVCHMAAPMLEDAGIQVHVTVPDEPVDTVADAVHVELALLNLISNSVDAMESGGSLAIRLVRVDDTLRLKVEDTGTGIPPALLAHIFEPWVTTKALGKGSGLGLSIARQVVASHGGTIRAENRVGPGAIVTIELPAAPSGSAPSQSAHVENSRR